MKPTLVTGGTGLVGFAVIETLLARGRSVRALVRSVDRARAILPEAVYLIEGDITDAASVTAAMKDCGIVHHAAGIPESWQRDETVFDRVNAQGTRNVVEACLELGVQRLVYTSTIDVFEAGPREEFDEESPIATAPKGTAYERSKQEADRIVVQAIAERGLDAVFVHPSAVYGPGPARTVGANQIFVRLRDGKMPALIPGGMPMVFSRDVGEGQVLAEEKGAAGDRYILSETYQELEHVAWVTTRALGRSSIPRILPLWLARLVAAIGAVIGRLTGLPPLVSPGELHFMQWKARPRNRKAREELGWKTTLFREGVHTTLEEMT